MPEQHKRFEIPVGPLGDFIRVVFARDGKKILYFVVQYEALIEGQERPVIRYDTAHGFAHCDILDWNGDSVWWRRVRDNIDYREAMNEAIEDLTKNWERHRADFLRRRP